MKYCVGCVSSDEVIALGDGVMMCPACGTTNFLSEAEFDDWLEKLRQNVESQLPGVLLEGVSR